MSKEDLNENASTWVLVFLGVALAALFGGTWLWVTNEESLTGWVAANHAVIGAGLIAAWFACMFLVAVYERGIRQWAADSRFARVFERRRQLRLQAAPPVDEMRMPEPGASGLRDVLQDRHGLRWRYRDRWILVVGDEPFVNRLVPGLPDAGYWVDGSTVLLYARSTRDTLDTAWLEQIRRLRRRRPVDAVVAVVRDRGRGNAPFDVDGVALRLARHARALRWSAPTYLLNATLLKGNVAGEGEPIGLTWSNPHKAMRDVSASLGQLVSNLAQGGVMRLTEDADDRYPAELSRHIQGLRDGLTELVQRIGRSPLLRRGTVHGLLFAPLPPVVADTAATAASAAPPLAAAGPANRIDDWADQPTLVAPQHALWQTVARHSQPLLGRRVGFSWSVATAWLTTAVIGCWIAGTVLSGWQNRIHIESAADTLSQLARLTVDANAGVNATDSGPGLLALDRLDKQIDTLEAQQRDGAPWRTRFGLNRDAALLTTLWPGYDRAAARLVVGPWRKHLEQRLGQLGTLTDAEIAEGGQEQVQAAYDTLKAYLMLAKPERASPAFLTPLLLATGLPEQTSGSTLKPGAWQDLRQHLVDFYVQHLKSRGLPGKPGTSTPAFSPDAALVASARQTIVGARGIQHSSDAVYQQIIDDAAPKYPPLSLVMLLGDSAPSGDVVPGSSANTGGAGLFNTAQTIPGVFTRAAWEERIGKAIDEADAQRNVAGDWVLTDNAKFDTAPSALKAELRQRYFDDYTRAWERFLNSLQWQGARTLSGTVDQLTLLGEPRRSPLVALMAVIAYQAGAGAASQSLSDTLISKAQQLVGTAERDPSKLSQVPPAPLAAAFGPILRLMGSDWAAGTPSNGKTTAAPPTASDLSLARYLERVTAMRLKTQQIVTSPDPDGLSRLAAQAVLQGKTSEIAESRDYASRVAASLGQEWAGLGDLLRAPLDQTWSVLVQPAATSLNELWRTAIVADWARAFGGRYPFADSDNDASIPEMARFMRLDNGLITQFVAAQLTGVVERQGDHWVATLGAQGGTKSGALNVDPAFLAGLNRLTRAATVLFPAGDAQVRYELRGVPTPGVTEMKVVQSGRALRYFNQKEEWVPFLWPGDALDNVTHVEWQSEVGGLRATLDAQGRFGWIRLLERAQVTPLDGARNLLTWQPDANPGTPLRVQLRAETGAGPLEVLRLRHFELPQRVFAVAAATPTANDSRRATAGGK